MTKKKIIAISFLIFFIILFIIGFIIYFVYGKKHADIFAFFISISCLYFIFYLTFSFLKIKKNDIKKEAYNSLIKPYEKNITNWKEKKENKVNKETKEKQEKKSESSKTDDPDIETKENN